MSVGIRRCDEVVGTNLNSTLICPVVAVELGMVEVEEATRGVAIVEAGGVVKMVNVGGKGRVAGLI